ncbi:MAG: hypothetical protein HQL44_08775 [Alphaproteobacteria bacterium]|nr:hypothetical protein [Alphaproteobacteria bacterium]
MDVPDGILQAIFSVFNAKKLPQNNLYVLTEDKAVSALKMIMSATSKELNVTDRRMTLVIGDEDPVINKVLDGIKGCKCDDEVTLDVLASSEDTLQSIKEVFSHNGSSRLKLGETLVVNYSGYPFLVAPRGYYFQKGPNFSYAEAAFIKDRITELLLQRASEIREDAA